MKKTIVYILIFISILALVLRFSSLIVDILGFKQQGGISVTSTPKDATVFLNKQEVGKTPYETGGLEAGEYIVRLEKDQAVWQGNVKLNGGTMTIINRDLAKDLTSSAGEVLTLTRGKGLTIISNPNNAKVYIDSKEEGNTPLEIGSENGEHTVLVEHSNYVKRSIRATLPEGFNLTVFVDLALSEADLSTISTPVVRTTPEVIVKTTPTGFLRVREKPSLSGKEIAQVNVGDTLILLEELSGWDRVRLSGGLEGYVSSTYVEKKTP